MHKVISQSRSTSFLCKIVFYVLIFFNLEHLSNNPLMNKTTVDSKKNFPQSTLIDLKISDDHLELLPDENYNNGEIDWEEFW